MRVVSIGDLVIDYYYKNGELLGVNGGMTSHNIIANLSIQKIDTAVFGTCGRDKMGEIAIKSLVDNKVDTTNIKILDDIETRCFHVSLFEENGKLKFTSKKRCPICEQKKWYDKSMIDINDIIPKIKEDDILVFDNLNSKNQEIIDKTSNKKMLDIGQFSDLDNYNDAELINKLKNKFEIINLNERVEKYLLTRFKLKNILEIYSLLLPKIIIVTRGKQGADFVFNDNLVCKKLETVSEEVDSTGAGDAFFSTFIKEYINTNFNINNDFIDNTFKKAVKLTNKVVKKIGARGHINKLYRIKKNNDECTCNNFNLVNRKQIKRCNININNLETRVINAVNSKASISIENIDFEKLNSCIFVGTGGSYAGANFASILINKLYGVNTSALLPRNVLYKNTQKIDKAFLFSYSGTTNDLLEGCKNIDNNNKYIITKGEVQKIVTKTEISENNIISYRTVTNKGKERGFLSFEGAVAPAALFLKVYLKEQKLDIDNFIRETMSYWNNYFKKYFQENKQLMKEILKKGNIFNIFTGDYVTSACFDLESKTIESGVFNCLIHEKKNFSHGRFINYEHLSQKINIYFKQKETTKYERELLNYLDNRNLIIIESRYNEILCEFDLLVATQFFVYHISNFLDIDMSKPTYSEDAMKIYFYKGNL